MDISEMAIADNQPQRLTRCGPVQASYASRFSISALRNEGFLHNRVCNGLDQRSLNIRCLSLAPFGGQWIARIPKKTCLFQEGLDDFG
jgi:hypothetical protein